MRLPNAAHEAHPWVIGDVAPDFTLLDVWALPAEGDAGDFDRLVEMIASLDPAHAASRPTRALFWVRLRLGALLRWDEEIEKRPIPGCAETSLRARLPAELRDDSAAIGDELRRVAGGFTPLYRTPREWAAEISNATVHGVLHLGWVARGGGRYRGQLGVYVKPRGEKGALYLKLIQPFRHFVVYPALMRRLARAWNAR